MSGFELEHDFLPQFRSVFFFIANQSFSVETNKIINEMDFACEIKNQRFYRLTLLLLNRFIFMLPLQHKCCCY